MERVKRRKKDFISVIIPAYSQEETIAQNLRVIKNILERLPYDFEIIIVVDGMLDKTFENAKKIKSPKIKIVGYKNNRGKGYAVRYGMVRSKGDIICFVDAGIDLNLNAVPILLQYFKQNNADIVIGSKRHPESRVIYPIPRRIISFLSQIFIRMLFGLNVRDTQVGMKMFKKNVIEDVMPRLLVKKFAFDIEMLVVANRLGYKKIFEAPVEIHHDFAASIISRNLWRELFRTLWDTLAIFYRLNLVKYYDSGSKRRWKFDPELNLRVNLP